MYTFSIGFDIERKTEFLSVLAPHKENGYYIFYPCEPEEKAIGTLLLEFLNLDLDDKSKTKEFIYKYLLGFYLINFCDFEELDYNKIFYKDELLFYLEDANLKLCYWLKKVQSDFSSSINHIFEGVSELIKKNHKEGDKIADYSDCYLIEVYATLFEYTENLFVDFELPNYCYINNSNNGDFDYENANVEIGFASFSFESILYISLRKLIFLKNILILRCNNCNDYFIPDSLHYPKYCNKLFKSGKTCKEIGALSSYKNKLKNNPLLKKYRARYSSLASNASNYPDNESAVKRFEKYKVKGSKMKALYLNNKISNKEFDEWIESTKIKK